MQESFWEYQKKRYLWISLILTFGALALYVLHLPLQSPNGGTWLGYTLGAIAALLIVWLLLFGVRKRSYRSKLGSVKGWLSAHVYLGTAVIVIATLHAGFQFGWNIHTVAYFLMIAVILSGFVGVYFYSRYPRFIASNRPGQTRGQLFEALQQLDRQAIQICEHIDSQTQALVESAVERTEVGGNWWAQLSGRDSSKIMLVTADSATKITDNADQRALVALLNNRLAESRGGEETAYLQELLGLIASKRTQLRQVRRDIRLQALVEFWLYLHVPLAFALLGALLAHILSVFTYW